MSKSHPYDFDWWRHCYAETDRARIHVMADFELRLESGEIIHRYTNEAEALAFVRDVVIFAGREAGACFELVRVTSDGRETIVAHGQTLMRLAVEDRLL